MFTNLNTRLKTIVKVMKGLNKIPSLILKTGFFISAALAIASIIMMVYASENYFINPSLMNIAESGIETSVSILMETTIGAFVLQYFFFRG